MEQVMRCRETRMEDESPLIKSKVYEHVLQLYPPLWEKTVNDTSRQKGDQRPFWIIASQVC